MTIKSFIFISLLLTLCLSVRAQHSDESAHIRQLQLYEDSLITLGQTFVNNENDLERKSANYSFIKMLVTALKIPNSFNFKFDSLKSISILNSPDSRFRLLTWHIVNEDGSNRFYGTIQVNTGKLLMYPLEDYSPLLQHPEDSVTDPHKWYGAQYYKIIPVYDGNPYYILLGWKGNTVQSTKKVIDVLTFKEGRPQFGMSIFDGNGKTRKRVIFEYTRQASMLLKFVPDQNLIVFDHLSPPDPRLKDDHSTYGPDLTYNGYKLKNGRWVLIENLDMRNIPEDHDADYVDPKKQAQIDRAALGTKKN